jgi:hypothetical protein
LKLLYDWRSVSQYVLVSGTLSGPMTRFYFFLSFAGQLLCSSSWGALSDERTGPQSALRSVSSQSRGAVTTILYCLILDYWVPFPSPLTTRRDYGGSILIRLHTRMFQVKILRLYVECQFVPRRKHITKANGLMMFTEIAAAFENRMKHVPQADSLFCMSKHVAHSNSWALKNVRVLQISIAGNRSALHVIELRICSYWCYSLPILTVLSW